MEARRGVDDARGEELVLGGVEEGVPRLPVLDVAEVHWLLGEVLALAQALSRLPWESARADRSGHPAGEKSLQVSNILCHEKRKNSNKIGNRISFWPH